MRPPVQIPDLTDDLPLDAMLATREQDRLDAEWEAAGGVTVDLTQEGLDKAAEGGARMGQGSKISRPEESASEQVRDRATADLEQGPVRKATDTVLRTLTGYGLDELQDRVNKGTLPQAVSLKLTDPRGSISEAMIAKTLKESGGVADEDIAGLAAKTSIALGMLPFGGFAKAGKKVAEQVAGELAGKAATLARGAETALPAVQKGFVRLYRGEAVPKDARQAAEWAEKALEQAPFRGNWFTEDLALATWYAQQAGPGARVKYVDVPKEVAESATTSGGKYPVLPPEWSSRATELPKTPAAEGGVKAGEQAIAGVNPSRLEGTAPDVAAVIQNIGVFNATRLERGTVSHAETIAKAEGLMPLAEALAVDVSKYDLATLQTAVAGHYKNAAAYYRDVAKRVVAGDKTAEAEYWGAFAVATQLAERDALLGTQVGRGLEARKIRLEQIGGQFDPADLQRMAETLAGGVEAGMTVAVHAARMAALKPAQQAVALKQTAGFWRQGQNALYEAWVNGLLSGPQTHVANMTSNALIAVWAPVERTLAAGLDVDALGGQRSVYFGEGVQMAYGMVEGLKDGIRTAGKALREGAAPGPQKLERPPAITAEAFGMDPSSVWGGTVDLFGAIVRTPGRLLVSEDALFKTFNYRGQLRALAYREAANEGLTGAPFWKRVKEIIADPPASVKEAADQFALTNTLNREYDQMGNLGAIGAAVAKANEKVPALRAITPFVRTPVNDAHFVSERVPLLNLLSDTLRADLQAGGAQRAEALAKITGGMGISMVVATYALAPVNPEAPSPYMTMITGEGPKDPRMRAQLETLGWKPYSVWNPVSHEYVSYRRLSPIGTIFGIVSTYTEVSGQLPEQGLKESVWAMGIATSKAMLSKTFLTGLSDFLDAMEGDAGDINRFFNGLARSGVPALVRQTTRTLDPIKRDVDTLFDHWRSGLPGYGGPPDHNLWGDEIMYSGGLGPDVVSPLYTSPLKEDPVTQWLVDNKVALTGAPKVVGAFAPGETPYIRTEAQKPVKLTVEERQRLKVLVGKGGSAPQEYGDLGPLAGVPPLKAAIAEIIQGDGTPGPNGTKADLIRALVNQRKSMAIQQLRRESPALDRELAQRTATGLSQKTGEAATAQDLTPFLMGR